MEVVKVYLTAKKDLASGTLILAIDPRDFRHALGCFASGVCVMTTQSESGLALGVTITSFCSVSLKPALVLFCLGKNTRNIDKYTMSKYFTVNMLSEDQLEISEKFASQSDNKFNGIIFEKGKNGCPTLPGCMANLECTLINTHDGGDHLILIGEVNYVQAKESGAPLVRYRGKYAGIGNRKLI